MYEEPRRNQAVLVFARDISLDLRRRGWGQRLRQLLQIPRFLAEEDADVHIFTSPSSVDTLRAKFPWAGVHSQSGSNFAECLERAVGELVDDGYGKIVIVGRDCPELTFDDVHSAFRELDGKRLVLGPDHQGGLYLIGLHVEDLDLLKGIDWQQDSDFSQISARVPVDRTFILPTRHDLDSTIDLRSLLRAGGAVADLVRFLIGVLRATALKVASGPRPLRRVREILSWQLPPPSVRSPLA